MVTSCCSLPRREELVINTTDIELDLEKLPWAPSDLTSAADGTSQRVMGLANPKDWRAVDMLATIFAGQRQLMETYDTIERRNGAVVVEPEFFGEVDDRRVQIRLKDLSERVVEELMEAMNCLKNKPWKDSFVATDVAHYQEELADTLHFFVELLITSGMTAEDIFKMYYRKHAINEFRQESKY